MPFRGVPLRRLILLLAVAALLWMTPCRAEEGGLDISVQADAGIGYFAPPKVTYIYSPANRGDDIRTREHATRTLGLKMGCPLKGLDWPAESLFGQAPVMELAYRYNDYDERAGDITPPNAADPAAGYGVTGPWSGGIWDYKQLISNHEFWLGLKGDEPENSGFIPYVGVGFQKYTQDWRLNNFIFGTYYNVFHSNLDAYSYGIRLGGEWRTGRFDGWQLSATPMLFVNYVRADLDFQQNNVPAILSAARDAMSTQFVAYGGSLDLSVRKLFDNGLSLGVTGGAVYNSRTPTVRPPETTQGRAQISGRDSSALRGGLDFGMVF